MINKRKTMLRSALLGTTAFAVSTAFGLGAYAQDQDQDETLEDIDTVIVTGSRLVNSTVNSPVPILQLDAQDFENRGVVRIEEMINRLPQFAPGQNANISNGANGTSTLNLRGLGATRTLVLLNGKRLPFGSPNSSAVNIDIIPAGLIERVDIVTGGASAVYGSDAVGGVANFILKEDFEGFNISGQVGIHHASNQNKLMDAILADAVANGDPTSPTVNPGAVIDGREVALNMTLGTNFADGRGNVTMHIAYQNANAITEDDRDFSACALTSGTGINQNAGCAGSSNFRKFTPPASDLFADYKGDIVDVATLFTLKNAEDSAFTLADAQVLLDTLPSIGEPFQTITGFLIPRTSPDGLPGVATTFNFGPTNFFRRPNERYNINALGNYQITDTVEVYFDAAFMNNFTDAQIAPSASFNRPFQTNCDNPLLLTGVNRFGTVSLFDLFGCQQVLDDFAAGDREDVDISFTNSHRNVEGGNRNLAFDLNTWRIVTGLRGTLADKFDWELFGQITTVNSSRESSNDLSFTRVQEALFVDPDDATKCRDGSAGCVPWNIFSRTASGDTLVSQEAADFIAGVGIVVGRTTQRVMGGTIQTDLTEQGFSTPWADSGLSVLAGYEYRRDQLARRPDDVSTRSAGRGLTGTGGGTLRVAGQITVWEVFMESALPLVQNQPGIEDLSISGAFRHSEYNTDGEGVKNSFGTNTWFIGGSWTPVSDIRFRAQFQRSIRAPNVFNLFTGQNTGLFRATQLANGSFDPCGGANPAATLAQCQNTGLTAALFGNVPLQPAGQLNTITGGNPNLLPENSDTITIGAVVTPQAVPGLTISIDYFDIQITEAIATIPPQVTLDQCIATGNPAFCSLITRDRFGSLWLDNANFEGILAGNVNIAELNRAGIDLQVSYDMSMDDLGLVGMGDLRFNLAGTYVFDDSSIPLPGGDLIECEGLFSGQCGALNPQWRHIARLTWDTPWDINTTLTYRFFGGATNARTNNPPNDLNSRVPAQHYLDVVVNYQATDSINLRIGINNLLGNTPHFASQGGNGNVFAGQHDIDRFIFFGFNLNY